MRLYTLKKEEKDGWIKAIKDAVGYSNLTDFYTIGVSEMLKLDRKSWEPESSGSSMTPFIRAPARM